jgi:hypothetical protein
MNELRIVLVAVLCLPILALGIKFVASLLDHTLAGKKKGKSN